MISTEFLSTSFDDVIFLNRNRDYGAFVLRQKYRTTLTHALGIGVGMFVAGLVFATFQKYLWTDKDLNNHYVMTSVTLEHLPETPIKQPVMLPPPPQAPPVNTVRNLPLEVKPEADVIEENLPPTTNQLENATSGTETAQGTGEEEVILAPEASVQPTLQEKAVEATRNSDEPFLAVEQNPEFPGGNEALRSFLQNNLKYPRAASSTGISGRVYVSFVVNTDGSLTDLHVLKGIGFGCDEEALRVLQKMPRWKPGKQSGRSVRVKFNLPITFSLE